MEQNLKYESIDRKSQKLNKLDYYFHEREILLMKNKILRSWSNRVNKANLQVKGAYLQAHTCHVSLICGCLNFMKNCCYQLTESLKNVHINHFLKIQSNLGKCNVLHCYFECKQKKKLYRKNKYKSR